MGRNLIICCDGTANEFAKDRTNVLKLAYAATKASDTQLLYYHPGVGTMAPPGAGLGLGRLFARLAGLGFGYGLQADIRDIYTFIIDHWQGGDSLYLFGFSRGAYTARAVAALLNRYGLIGPGNAALVPYAIKLLWRWHAAKDPAAKSAWFELAEEFKAALSVSDCAIHFLGVWDTVSSVGWYSNPLSLPDTAALPNVKTVRHAVSIDERRAFFRTNLVRKPGNGDVKEVWFPGSHCDVGGGYSETTSGLSKIALEWMVAQATDAGMLFDNCRVATVLGRGDPGFVPPQPGAAMHNSLTPLWWPAEFLPKKHYDHATGQTSLRPNLFRRRHFDVAPCIHESAWDRGAAYLDQLPADARKVQTG